MEHVMIPAHQLEFVAANRLCVLGWNRGSGSTEGPPLTPVFYVTDGDDVLVSITEDRAKTRALRRDPAISVCVLGEEMPFPVRHALRERDDRRRSHERFEVMARVVERMGRTLDDDARKKLHERADREHRVVLRVTPQRSVSNLPPPP